jgi:hypothetical protein
MVEQTKGGNMEPAALFVPLIPLALMAMVGYVVKAILDNVTKQKLFREGATEEMLRLMYQKDRQNAHPVAYIKWALLAVAMGLPLCFTSLIQDFTLLLGLILILIGLAFFVYYRVALSVFVQDSTQKPDMKE